MSSIMRVLSCILLSFISWFCGYSQDFGWAKGMGASGSDWGLSIATDNDENVYTTGYFQQTVDFNPGPDTLLLTSTGNRDIFIQKLDSLGNFLWSQSFGSRTNDIGSSIAVDSTGNVFVTGYFTDTVDFDPGPGLYQLVCGGLSDCFVLKLDPQGNLLWAKQIDGPGRCEGSSINLDNTGHVYVTGFFNSVSDFDPGPLTFNLGSFGEEDVFILKLDTSGQFTWVRQLGGSSIDQALDLALDYNGNVYTIGHFYGTSDFDPGPAIYNLGGGVSDDVFIQKMDPLGNFLWAKSISGTSYEIGNAITTDLSGNVYSTGYFSGTADFNPGSGIFNLTSYGSADIFVQKLDSSGNFLWANNFGGPFTDQGNSITTDALGNVYLFGNFRGKVDFDPSHDSVFLECNLTNAFMVKLDEQENLMWVIEIKSSRPVYGEDLSVTLSNTIYSTGSFRGDTDFDPGIDTFTISNPSISNGDIFVQKLNPCRPFIDSITVIKCWRFISPSSTKTFDSSGIYWDTIFNGYGCDTVIWIDLIIDGPEISVVQNSDTLEAFPTGTSYQWVNCDSNYTPLLGDTTPSLIPSSTGNYAIIITRDSCIDTSNCYYVIASGKNTLNNPFDLKVYPNPTNGILNLEVGEELGLERVILINVIGHRILDQTTEWEETNQITIGGPPGIYFLMIESNEGRKHSMPIVKN